MSAAREKRAPRHWLVKTEPESYSIADLARDRVTGWDGVRNYQARNTLRDEMAVGDRVLFYHSSTEPPAVVGLAEVAGPSRPDPTAFDRKDHHYDPKSDREKPTWFLVDIKHVETFPRALPREELAAVPALRDMVLLKRGSRLSVQPVTAAEFATIVALAHRGAAAGADAPSATGGKDRAKKASATKDRATKGRTGKAMGTLLLAALCACAAAAGACTEQPRHAGSLELPPPGAGRLLTVTGTGRMTLPPSEVTFECVLRVTAPTADAAWSAGSARVTKLTKALEQAGVHASDLVMRSVLLAPHPVSGTTPARCELEQRLAVTLRELARLPGVLTVVQGAGADGVENARFGITDRRMAGDRARERAMIEARDKAEMLAQEVGLRLGPVHAIEEQPLAAPAAAGSLEAPPGSFEVVSQLVVSYELQD